jgi:hypothetical protein
VGASNPTNSDYAAYICRGVHCKCMNLDGKCPNYHNGDHACPSSTPTNPEKVCPRCAGTGHGTTWSGTPFKDATIDPCLDCHGKVAAKPEAIRGPNSCPSTGAGNGGVQISGAAQNETRPERIKGEGCDPSIPPTPPSAGTCVDLPISQKPEQITHEITHDPAGEGELEQMQQRALNQQPNGNSHILLLRKDINAYIARRVLEVIGEDDEYHKLQPCPFCHQPYQFSCNCGDARNELRAEQRQRIAVIKKESQQ